jgi:hypothetical protein
VTGIIEMLCSEIDCEHEWACGDIRSATAALRVDRDIALTEVRMLRAENERLKAELAALKEGRLRNERCPSCGMQTLFINPRGAITCSWLDCKAPVVLMWRDKMAERDAALRALEVARRYMPTWNLKPKHSSDIALVDSAIDLLARRQKEKISE